MATDPTRAALESRWLDLTQRLLPGVAVGRGWPVRADHCFQRIFLDTACGGVWYDRIAARPAYRHAPDDVLRSATDLAEAALAGHADLSVLNSHSLAWRRTRKGRA